MSPRARATSICFGYLAGAAMQASIAASYSAAAATNVLAWQSLGFALLCACGELLLRRQERKP
jgi:hypothetical protein